MQRHPLTTTLSLLIMSEGMQRRHTDFDEAVHTVIARLLHDWTDEDKADLYARLAESVHAGQRLADIEVAVDKALTDNARYFTRG